jgi:hypothetical protein
MARTWAAADDAFLSDDTLLSRTLKEQKLTALSRNRARQVGTVGEHFDRDDLDPVGAQV